MHKSKAFPVRAGAVGLGGREVELIGNPIPYLLWAYFVMFIDGPDAIHLWY